MVEALVGARTAAKRTQAEVARRLGTTQSAIARIPHGRQHRKPHARDIFLIGEWVRKHSWANEVARSCMRLTRPVDLPTSQMRYRRRP